MGRPASVAVVGAGMAGAVAALSLARAGLSVTVLHKGRDVGGRMATRLGACGDGCLGPRIEAAFDSSEALAARIVATLR